MKNLTYLNRYFNKNFLSNKTNYAPHGVLFVSDKKVFVGMDHGKLPLISPDLFKNIISIAEIGLYYEGMSGSPDVKLTEPLFGKYTSGFDYMAENSIRGHPSQYLYALFSNNPPESVSSYIVSNKKGDSIFNAMVKAGNKISSLKKSKPNAKTVKEFLTSISSTNINFLKIALESEATEENAIEFIKLGANEMWPHGTWQNYSTNAGKVAKKANDFRDSWCAKKGPDGLYTIGSGHLFAISSLTNKPIIDGSGIQR
jgi:hypothetical protein